MLRPVLGGVHACSSSNLSVYVYVNVCTCVRVYSPCANNSPTVSPMRPTGRGSIQCATHRHYGTGTATTRTYAAATRPPVLGRGLFGGRQRRGRSRSPRQSTGAPTRWALSTPPYRSCWRASLHSTQLCIVRSALCAYSSLLELTCTPRRPHPTP